MRKVLFIILTVIVFVVMNGLIVQKENILKNGKTVLLALAPWDPRSLFQGDYMQLRYEIGRAIETVDRLPGDYKGKIVLNLNANGVGTFVRLYKGEELVDNEQLLIYRYGRKIRFGAETFFYQEKHAKYYTRARYGELRVSADGDSVLVGLRDEKFNRLGPGLEQEQEKAE